MRRSYLDDRFELFGKEAILEYVDVLSGGPVWDTVRDRDRHRDGLAATRPRFGEAAAARIPAWTVIYRDKVSILFKQAPASQLTAR